MKDATGEKIKEQAYLINKFIISSGIWEEDRAPQLLAAQFPSPIDDVRDDEVVPDEIERKKRGHWEYRD